jgi:integrase/recombinase XerD
MPIRLDMILRKVEQMSNKVNPDLLKDFYQHMKDNSTSQNYQKGNLKAVVHFAEHIGAATSFYDLDHNRVVGFLDTKIKPEQIDSDKKWITTWNGYLWRLKLFFRWLQPLPACLTALRHSPQVLIFSSINVILLKDINQ